jgi:hypothetical protein
VRQARDGRLVPISLSVSPILNADGVVVGASKIARDISDRKRAEYQLTRAAARDAFLAEATLTLTRSLDYEATLQSLARLAVPYLADYCAFDVIGEDGTMACVAATHVLPEKVSAADVLREDNDSATRLVSPARVMRTREGVFGPPRAPTTSSPRARCGDANASSDSSLWISSRTCVCR